MSDVLQKQRQRWIEGAVNYAKADVSDPFAFARCMTHINNGIVGPNNADEEAMYTADPVTEMRPSPMKDGTEYPVIVYRNVKRP